jgi:hypothetical protein
MENNYVSFLPTNILLSLSSTEEKLNGDISTSWDIEKARRWRGLEGVAMTYMSPD